MLVEIQEILKAQGKRPPDGQEQGTDVPPQQVESVSDDVRKGIPLRTQMDDIENVSTRVDLCIRTPDHVDSTHVDKEAKAMTTILYARVSTADQNIEIQRAQAEKAGFTIDEVVADDGVSGVSVPLRERPEGRRLFDLLRRGDTLVVRWVDRLGRDYRDVTENIRAFMDRGVVVKTVISAMTFDGATQDPIAMAVRDALIAFMAATAQAQAEATRSAQKAGIAAARERNGAYRGRKPAFTTAALEIVLDELAKGAGPSEAAKAAGVSRQTVYRVKADPAAARAVLEVWGL